jgi:acyl-CoA dehydrogenase
MSEAQAAESEERAILAETLARWLGDALGTRDAASASADLDRALWAQAEELGLPALLVPEAAGGAGGSLADALVVAHAVGRFAAPLPLVEALLAAHALAEAGIDAPAGPLGLATRCEGTLRGGRFTGALHAVPFGAQLAGVVAVAGGERDAEVVLLAPRDAAVEPGRNLAGEPRDRLRFDGVPCGHAPAAAGASARLFEHHALLRTGQIAGALATALARSIAHASQRVQFGKTLAQFQAVQQQLAVMGEEVMAVDCAAGAAARAADRGEARFEIACARLRANLAIEACTATAHQIHGAIGFTHEQDLRLYTQRLLAWRSEHGSDQDWAAWLGARVAERGGGAFWADLTGRG